MVQQIGVKAIIDASQVNKGVNTYVKGLNTIKASTKNFDAGLTKTNAGLKKFDTGISKFGKGASSAGGKAKGLNTSLGSLATSFTGVSLGAAGVAGGIALVGTALVSFGKDAVREGTAFQKAMSGVGAISGAVGKDFAALESQAKSLGATTKFTAIEAADGMKFLAQAGFETSEILLALPPTLDLAAASNLGLGESADIVSNILTGFGAQAQETGRFVDVLTKTFTTSNTDLLQLGQAMKFVAPVARSLGVSLEETAAAIGKLSDAGIQGEMAGTALRQLLLSLGAPTTKAAEEMKALGINIFNASGEMLPLPEIIGNLKMGLSGLSQEQQAVAVKTLVGSRNFAALNVLLAEGELSLQGYTNSLTDVGVAAEIAALQLDNLAGDQTLLNSAISGLKIEIFEELEPTLRRTSQAMLGLVTRSNEVFTIWSSNIGMLNSVNAQWRESSVVISAAEDAFVGLANPLGGAANLWQDLDKIINGTTDSIDNSTQSLNKEVVGLAKVSKENQLFIRSGELATKTQKEFNESVFEGVVGLSQLSKTQQLFTQTAANVQESNLTKELTNSLDLTSALTSIDAGLFNPFKDIFAAVSTGDIGGSIDDALGGVGGSIGSSINEALSGIKSAVSQISGLTFSEILPPQETFRVDEWVRRLAAVAQDGSNEWATKAVETFGGQAFIQPLADAIAANDPAAISAAAEELINGPNIIKLMNIEGAIDAAADIQASQNLQDKVDQLIIDGLAGRQGGVTLEGEGIVTGQDIVALANVPMALTEAQSLLAEQGLGEQFSTILGEAFGGTIEDTEGSGLLSQMLGIGSDGVFNQDIALLTTEQIPLMQEAFTLFFESTTLGFDTMKVATDAEIMTLSIMSNVTLPTLQASSTVTFNAITKLIGGITVASKDMADGIIKDFERSEKASARLEEKFESLARALDAIANAAEAAGSGIRGALGAGASAGLGSSGGLGASVGIGYSHGTPMPTSSGGMFGVSIPAGFPNDTFPLRVESGEQLMVSPRGTSLDSIIANKLGLSSTGGSSGVNIEMIFTGNNFPISNQSDVDNFAKTVAASVREVTERIS